MDHHASNNHASQKFQQHGRGDHCEHWRTSAMKVTNQDQAQHERSKQPNGNYFASQGKCEEQVKENLERQRPRDANNERAVARDQEQRPSEKAEGNLRIMFCDGLSWGNTDTAQNSRKNSPV